MMASRRTLLVLGILLAILILATLHETEAKGSRGHSRNISTRSRKTQRTGASKPKAKPKTFHSSVTHSQTQATKKFDRRFVVAAATGILTYHLFMGPAPPVYSGRYRPYHETSNIVIPKHRALTIRSESYHVFTKNGSRCQNGNLTKYDARNVVNVTTKVSYEKAKHVGEIKAIPSIETTDTKQTNLAVSAEAINDYVAMIEIRITFNQSILTLNATSNTTIDLTNCTIMVYESKAYVVESFAFMNKASFVLLLFALFVSIMA